MLPLDRAITPSRDTLEIESFLAKDKELVSTIKSLGVDRFRKYFLDGVSSMTSREIPQECDLPIVTVKKINDFVDKFYLKSTLTEPIGSNRTVRIYYSTIVPIEKNNGQLAIDYFSSEMAKGRYLKPFTQVSLSRKIGVNPSLISRAISRKAIRTPQGRQISPKTLFPSEREIRKKFIREIIEREKSEIQSRSLNRAYSDEEIRTQLRRKYGTSIPLIWKN